MRLKWEREMECFKMYAQPIEDWAQMSQTTAASAPAAQPNTEEPKEIQTKSGTGSTTYRDLRTNRLPGARKIDVRVQINHCELWSLDERDSGRCFWETLNSLLGALNEADPPVWIEDRPGLEARSWYVIFKGRRWDGEPLIDMGVYDVRFRLRGMLK
jgi:hypothetical protein